MLTSREELVRPDRHIFLSPHYDDIALSCGGTAATLSSSGRTPEVALIFGDHPDPDQPMTAFAEELHRQWGMSAAEVIEGRRREEQMASIALGTCDRFLPFKDAIYRGQRYQSDDELFGPPKEDEDYISDRICDELQITSRDEKRTRIYAPLAIGNHVDHQHAYRTGLCLQKRGYEVWFYEDLPYGLKPAHVAARSDFLTLDRIVAGPVVDVSGEWDRKIDAVMAYPSQLEVIFGQYVGVQTSRQAISDAMTDYAMSVGDGKLAERFWIVDG